MIAADQRREDRRQLIHLLAGLPVCVLPWIPQAIAIAAALVAVSLNALLLPRLLWTRSLFREDEMLFGGIVLYPGVVLLVLIALPNYPVLAGATWCILATGDVASNTIGRRFGRKRWSYHVRKSVAGTVAFFVAATAATTALLCGYGLPLDAALEFALTASLVAAVVESLPLPIDDNLTVGLAAGLTLFVVSRWGAHSTLPSLSFVCEGWAR